MKMPEKSRFQDGARILAGESQSSSLRMAPPWGFSHRRMPNAPITAAGPTAAASAPIVAVGGGEWL
jgi:hypothetical protein